MNGQSFKDDLSSERFVSEERSDRDNIEDKIIQSLFNAFSCTIMWSSYEV